MPMIEHNRDCKFVNVFFFVFQFIVIGVVTGIEANHKSLTEARKGMEVCVKIDSPPGEAPKMYGRHFDHTDLLVSKVKLRTEDANFLYFV